MSHEVFGDRVIVVGESAWHRIGKVKAAGTRMLAREAVTEAGMDDSIVRIRPTVSLPDGTVVDLPDVATYRAPTSDDPNWKYFGTQSAEFTPITNMELAGLMDDSGITKEFPVATAGSLRDGRVTFITLDVGMTTIGGENVGQYIAINDGKDGSRGLNLLYTNVREVCANTVAMAETSSKINIQLVHRPSVRGDFELAMDLMAAIKRTTAEMRERFERMTLKTVSFQQIEAILEAAYPVRDRGGKSAIFDAMGTEKIALLPDAQQKELRKAKYISDQAASRALERRAEAFRNYERICGSSELLKPNLRGTAWAIFNAVTEMENHRPGWGEVEESILIGERNQAMIRTLKAVEAV